MTKPTGRRFEFETRTYTPAEHRLEWMRRVQWTMEDLIDVLETPPPLTYTVQVEVPKDDPRYEKAPISEDWIWFGPCLKTEIQKLHPDNGR
jgi:hypothetical protein